MYIPDFWCGVIATILVEVACAVIGSIIDKRKNKKEATK